LKTITGHRFGFDAIGFESKTFDTAALHAYLDKLQKEVAFFETWIMDIPSLWDRFDTTGVLKKTDAIKYDTVGVMARASGLPLDRREDPFYLEHGFVLQTQQSGDVAARFKLRLQEVENSIEMMHRFLEGEESESSVNVTLAEDGDYVSFAESSLGELFMNIEIKEGVIERFFVRDPSFMNWQALHLMMPGNIIADFPLINKSCDLSYAGNDL